MNILVTGAKGMVGTALCNNLKNIRDGKNKTRPALDIKEIYEYDLDSTSEELDEGMTAKQMYRDIKERMTGSERYYLLLDEVQEVDGWEKAVNSLLEDSNTDIYVTGSNSKLMSGEIDVSTVQL